MDSRRGLAWAEGEVMAAHDACLTVSASYLLGVIEQTPLPDVGGYEHKIRCRVIGETSVTVIARFFEWADMSGTFRKMAPAPIRTIPKDHIIREEPWNRGAVEGR